jgi:hypothetical protein
VQKTYGQKTLWQLGEPNQDMRVPEIENQLLKTREPAMFKIGLMALSAILLTFASAKAVDNAASANAAAAFGQFGLQGLAVAGRAPDGNVFPPLGPPFVADTSVGPPVYTPVCWTQFVTVANGNTLVNFPNTICR